MLTTSQTLNDLEISRAYELRPGATYAIKLDAFLPEDSMKTVAKMVAAMEEKTGCRFIILEKCFDLVAPKPDTEALAESLAKALGDMNIVVHCGSDLVTQ